MCIHNSNLRRKYVLIDHDRMRLQPKLDKLEILHAYCEYNQLLHRRNLVMPFMGNLNFESVLSALNLQYHNMGPYSLTTPVKSQLCRMLITCTTSRVGVPTLANIC